MRRWRGRNLPSPALALVVAALTALAGALVVGCAVAGLAVAGVLRASTGYGVLGGGLAASLVVGGLAGLLATRLASALRGVRERVLDGMAAPLEPSAPGAGRRPAPAAPRAGGDRARLLRGASELTELDLAVRALQVRARLSDDVAERHRGTADAAAAGLGEVLGRLVVAEEAARGQLAAELHDTVAQSLLAARMLLADDPALSPAGERALESMGEAEEQVRALMARTRPPELRSGDLAQAVSTLRDDLARRYGLHVALRWPARARALPLVSAVTAYRFLQEALLNVVKHGDGDRASACLEVSGDTLLATVTDEGPGFDPAAVRGVGGRSAGLGLLRERARAAGGRVVVESCPGAATTVRLTLPLPRSEPPAELPARSVVRDHPLTCTDAAITHNGAWPGLSGAAGPGATAR